MLFKLDSGPIHMLEHSISTPFSYINSLLIAWVNKAVNIIPVFRILRKYPDNFIFLRFFHRRCICLVLRM